MRKFRIISDLHLEKNNLKNVLNNLYSFQHKKEVNNLIIAGDLTTFKKKNLLNDFFNELKYYKNIVYVLGNHEYIGTEFRKNHSQSSETKLIIDDYKNVCDKFNNVKIIENESISIDKINIYGMTLWTNFLKSKTKYSQNMLNEYNFSKKKLLKQQSFDMIISHYVPSHSLNNTGYYYGVSSDSNHLLYKSKYWIYGHIHKPNIKKIDECLTVCNPLGYNDYIIDFD